MATLRRRFLGLPHPTLPLQRGGMKSRPCHQSLAQGRVSRKWNFALGQKNVLLMTFFQFAHTLKAHRAYQHNVHAHPSAARLNLPLTRLLRKGECGRGKLLSPKTRPQRENEPQSAEGVSRRRFPSNHGILSHLCVRKFVNPLHIFSRTPMPRRASPFLSVVSVAFVSARRKARTSPSACMILHSR